MDGSRIRKKKLLIPKYPDTCERGLSGSPNECWLHTSDACEIKTWSLGLGAPLVAHNKEYQDFKIIYFVPKVDIYRYQLSSSLTFAVYATSCYTGVNNLGPVQVFEPPCCCKALTFSDSGKLSIKARQGNLVAVT